MTWVYKRVASEQNFNYQAFTMTTTTALEQQIAALLHQLEETKEAEKQEEARREAEAAAEKAREEEQHRLQAEAEAECARHDAEECRIEQEWRKREEEEEAARQCRSCKESALTLLAALEMELPKSKGKGPELAPESEGGDRSHGDATPAKSGMQSAST